MKIVDVGAGSRLCLISGPKLLAMFLKIFRQQRTYALGISSGDLLILTKFRIMNYNYLFVFLTEKINILLVNQTFFFSVLNWFSGAESKQYQIFVHQN